MSSTASSTDYKRTLRNLMTSSSRHFISFPAKDNRPKYLAGLSFNDSQANTLLFQIICSDIPGTSTYWSELTEAEMITKKAASRSFGTSNGWSGYLNCLFESFTLEATELTFEGNSAKLVATNPTTADQYSFKLSKIIDDTQRKRLAASLVFQLATSHENLLKTIVPAYEELKEKFARTSLAVIKSNHDKLHFQQELRKLQQDNLSLKEYRSSMGHNDLSSDAPIGTRAMSKRAPATKRKSKRQPGMDLLDPTAKKHKSFGVKALDSDESESDG